MANVLFKKYKSYQDFVSELLVYAMQKDFVSIICNYKDYNGVISSLNEKTINGNSLYLSVECVDSFDEDIVKAEINDGNMLITICANGEIIGEPIIFKTVEAFAPITYFVEYDAKFALEYPIQGNIIPFQIEKVKM